jgi:glycine/D-amino acid oxidase-like deaminating enzyme
MPDFDLAVIGAGAAGLSAAAGAAAQSCRVALIERDRMGGRTAWRSRGACRSRRWHCW